MTVGNRRALMLDHEDSFVFNLVDELRALEFEVQTIRATTSLDGLQRTIARIDPGVVILSPGPGHPSDPSRVTIPWLSTDPRIPILGICLGHQALAVAEGSQIGRSSRPVHGQATAVDWHATSRVPLESLEPTLHRPFGRYHSLVVKKPLPASLETLATCRDERGEELVMALSHRHRPRVGLQFHPESILSPEGSRVLRGLLYGLTESTHQVTNR
ncbi:MAG: aminodeoxychorismate/anthranilate synthase component II [Planctomycetota bacterium]